MHTVEERKDNFEELINPGDTPYHLEALLETSAVAYYYSWSNASMLKRPAGVLEFCSEMLKAVDFVWVTWLMHIFSFAWKAETSKPVNGGDTHSFWQRDEESLALLGKAVKAK